MAPAKKNNRLAYNFLSLGFVQVINSSLQLLVIPYMIKTVGADGFGVIAVAQVVMFYLSTFTEYGFNQSATRSVALCNADPEKISVIFFRVFFSKLLLCLIAFMVLLLLLFILPIFRAHTLLYLMAFTYVVGQSLLVNWLFQGLEKMWFIVLITLAGRLLFVALVFLFIKNKSDDFLFLLFMGIGNILAGIISIFLAFRAFRLMFKKPAATEILPEIKEGWHFTLTNLSMNTCQYANIFVLRFFTNDLVVGYYSIAEKIYFTIKQALVIFSQSIYPRICQLVEKGEKELILFLRKTYLPFLACIAAGALLLALLSPQLLYFFSGAAAVHSVFILQWLCVVLVIICLNIPSTLVLLALNRKTSYFRVYTLGGLLNISANIFFAYFLHTKGTLISIFITEIFITSGVLYESRRAGITWRIKTP